MPQLNISNTATAASVVNVIAGWQYEYLPWPARIKLLIRATIVGVTLVVFSGSETIMEESPIQAGGTAGGTPSERTTPPLRFPRPAGARRQIKLPCPRAPAGAANGSALPLWAWAGVQSKRFTAFILRVPSLAG